MGNAAIAVAMIVGTVEANLSVMRTVVARMFERERICSPVQSITLALASHWGLK